MKSSSTRSSRKLGELQELLFAAGTNALLIVLQGMDTSGKDGTIRNVLGKTSPAGVHVWSFKVPTEDERAHDFLWRHHLHTPSLSMIAVFNRSYYEAVLVELVNGIASSEVVLVAIRTSTTSNCCSPSPTPLVAKFFLHISQTTQEERLLERQQEVEKWWKLSLGDWQDPGTLGRVHGCLRSGAECHRDDSAAWYVVPSDRKWYRNLAVAQALVETLRPYRDDWLAALRERGEQELSALREAGYAEPKGTSRRMTSVRSGSVAKTDDGIPYLGP